MTAERMPPPHAGPHVGPRVDFASDCVVMLAGCAGLRGRNGTGVQG